MNIKVNTYNAIEGFHCWEGAKGEVNYLASRHRHIFVIRCAFLVTHEDRQIEINTQQNEIEAYLTMAFGSPCEFKGMSCEMIAAELMSIFAKDNIVECQVLEDGYGGATLTR